MAFDYTGRGTARHEAAHAVVGYLVLGEGPWYIEWIPEQQTAACQYHPCRRECSPPEQEIMVHMAGDLLARRAPDTPEDCTVRRIAREHCLTSDDVRTYSEQTRKMLTDHRAAVEALADVVLDVVVCKHRTLDGERIMSILEEHLRTP